MELVNIQKIVPLHEPKNMHLFATILQNMCVNGWVGDPIAAVEIDGTFFALTGSHRIAAAKACEIQEIPVEVIPDGTFTAEQWEELGRARNTDEIKNTLQWFYDDGIKGVNSVLKLLEKEVEKEA